MWMRRLKKSQALSAPFAEVVERTPNPFISAIRDSLGERAVAYDGKLMMVGDAFSLFKPHAGASTAQAAKHALGLAEVFEGKETLEEWEKSAIQHSRITRAVSLAFGEYSLTGVFPELLKNRMGPDRVFE